MNIRQPNILLFSRFQICKFSFLFLQDASESLQCVYQPYIGSRGQVLPWRLVSHLPSTVAALAAEVLAVGQ